MEWIDLKLLNDGRSRQQPRPKSSSTYEANHIGLTSRCKTDRIVGISQQNIQVCSPISFVNCNQELNGQLLEAVLVQDIEEIIRLLGQSANPNATCRLSHVSACHVAALRGGESLALLLRAGAETNRFDNFGRTPLHLAAWAGNAKEIAILLDFPEDLQNRISDMSSETEEEIERLRPAISKTANVICDAGVINVLPRSWMDGIGHSCRNIIDNIPVLNPKWTPLHAASFAARAHCVRLLLAAGSDPGAKDVEGHIPLDVAGCAIHFGYAISSVEFTETIKVLIQTANGNYERHTQREKTYSSLHTAVEVGNLDAIRLLLDAGVTLHLNKAGLTPMHLCVKKQLKEHLQLLVNHNYILKSSVIDCKDKDGFTVLHTAVRTGWMPGISIALTAGADITVTADNGQTAFHDAASLGNLEVLNKILEAAKLRNVMECKSLWGETPLYPAIRAGHLDCVKKLVKEGASLKHILKGDMNVLHFAAYKGYLEILRFLLDYDKDVTQSFINSKAYSCQYYDFSPLHIAVFYDRIECVKLLLARNANVRLCSKNIECSTALHIAAMKNHLESANTILEFDKDTLNIANDLGWYPLHTACYNSSRDCIKMMLQEGADMSLHTAKSNNETAFSMIMSNLSKPTEFMVDIFDSCIKTRTPSYWIDVNYSILTPHDADEEQLKVIHALRNTGNRYNQKTLLLHPLVESFLYLKWIALLPFFYATLIIYSIFSTSLTILIMSVFSFKDNKEAPTWMNTIVWSYIVYVAVSFVLILEIIYSLNIKTKSYLFHLETLVKFSSILLGIGLATEFAVIKSDIVWIRHLSTTAVLFSWIEMMFLLSRLPEWGYYFLMFGTVAAKILKILLTFIFLLIGFSLGFMIQFHFAKPFDNVWSAVVKTIVMMTSEFDYDDLFKDKHSQESATIVLQMIFLVFVITTAIVLMNMMVGVAVNDVHNLELIGNIKRIEKQIDLLGSLESLVYSNIFNKILPKCLMKSLQTRRKARKHIRIQLGESVSYNNSVFPNHITDRIIDKALTISERVKEQNNSDAFKTVIDEIYKATVLKKETEIDTIEDQMNKNIGNLKEERKQFCVSFIDDDCNTKIYNITKEIDSIKHSLLRMEKYFEKQ